MPSAAPKAAPLAQFGAETINYWATAADLWITYMGDLVRSPTPQGILAANTKLMVGALEACSCTAGSMLRQAGVQAPLLNDA